MEATFIPQMKEDWTRMYLAQQLESREARNLYIAVLTTITMHTTRDMSTKAYNPDCTRLNNG